MVPRLALVRPRSAWPVAPVPVPATVVVVDPGYPEPPVVTTPLVTPPVRLATALAPKPVPLESVI